MMLVDRPTLRARCDSLVDACCQLLQQPFVSRFLIILLVGNGISRTIFEDMQLQLVRQLDTLLSGNASLALAALLKVRCGDSMCQDMLVTMLTAGLR